MKKRLKRSSYDRNNKKKEAFCCLQPLFLELKEIFLAVIILISMAIFLFTALILFNQVALDGTPLSEALSAHFHFWIRFFGNLTR